MFAGLFTAPLTTPCPSLCPCRLSTPLQEWHQTWWSAQRGRPYSLAPTAAAARHGRCAGSAQPSCAL
jgi:hypothetical protein